MSEQVRRPVRLGDDRAWLIGVKLESIRNEEPLDVLSIQIHPKVVRAMGDEMLQLEWELQQIDGVSDFAESPLVHRDLRSKGLPARLIEMLNRRAANGDDRWQGTRTVT